MARAKEIRQQLLAQYGPLLGGSDLVKVLGFRTAAAMKKALRSGHLRLNIFHIEGRRGLFCLTEDAAAWLASVADAAHSPRKADKSDSGGKPL